MPRKGVVGEPSKRKGVKNGEGKFTKEAKAAWMKEYNKQYALDHPDKVRAYKRKGDKSRQARGLKKPCKKRQHDKLKEFINSLKSGGCVICGYKKCLTALDFHHVPGEVKERAVSQANTISAAVREAAKCIVVCANCHREIHSGSLEVPT